MQTITVVEGTIKQYAATVIAVAKDIHKEFPGLPLVDALQVARDIAFAVTH